MATHILQLEMPYIKCILYRFLAPFLHENMEQTVQLSLASGAHSEPP